jgi:DNA-binding MarR family transcriptional regulator
VRAADLTVAQYAALLGLAESPGISGAALARSCLVTPQAMAAVLKGLEEHGLVERSRHAWHGNVLELRLTKHGEQTLRVADHEAVKSSAASSRRFPRRSSRRCVACQPASGLASMRASPAWITPNRCAKRSLSSTVGSSSRRTPSTRWWNGSWYQYEPPDRRLADT